MMHQYFFKLLQVKQGRHDFLREGNSRKNIYNIDLFYHYTLIYTFNTNIDIDFFPMKCHLLNCRWKTEIYFLNFNDKILINYYIFPPFKFTIPFNSLHYQQTK